jgi:hypothetical protein
MNKRLFVAWREGDDSNGRWGPVGRLDQTEAGYQFVYTQGARTLAGFPRFSGMDTLEEVYESRNLFPVFANRLLAPSRPEYEAFLLWGGFDPRNPPDPVAVLSITAGRRATDAFELFPCPCPQNGRYVNNFFLHGVRWMPAGAQERIARLNEGESLGLLLDVCNRYDPNAVAVRTCDRTDRFMIGYVPRYQAGDIRELCSMCDAECITLTVRRVNCDAPLQQRVLCHMEACWPESFQPCSAKEFHPIPSEVPSEAY